MDICSLVPISQDLPNFALVDEVWVMFGWSSKCTVYLSIGCIFAPFHYSGPYI